MGWKTSPLGRADRNRQMRKLLEAVLRMPKGDATAGDEKGMKRVAMVKNGQLVGMLTEDLAMKKASVPVKTRVSQK